MTVILPDKYHAQSSLEARGVSCITEKDALHQDIRPLRIGILNIMPNANSYEFNLLFPLGLSVLQIIPVWIRLTSHGYKSTDKEHLDRFYVTFSEAIKGAHLDGLIVTGAPVEGIEFEKVHYWPEVKKILNYAYNNIVSTLGICWGGLALAKFINIDKSMLERKLFGVFELRNLISDHPITGNMDDVSWCPQSRFAGIESRCLEAEREKGNINLLAFGEEVGYSIFETTDHRLIMHLGHLEYNSGRLVDEAERDRKKGRQDVDAPKNFPTKNPINRWRANRNEFFRSWLKYIYLTTKY